MHLSNITTATPAVRVINGCKTYGKSVVLQGLNMTVERGVTYALLGSSGCGKTTLLSSIVGAKTLSSGSVQIFGKCASKTEKTSIGYMPQESGLHVELTISEELHFFGRLYGMDWSFVEERICFLVSLLQLPGENCLIQNLSGGETRRVSLAVTLLHKPPLLILDEATVGVDPLLRSSIWEHLYELVKEDNTTIICSTHYTEEARQADIVSVMRNGKLLVEEDPETLMKKFEANLLEDVVLKLCHSQELEQCSIKNDMNSWNNNNINDLDGNILNISYKRRSSRDSWIDVTSSRKYSNYSDFDKSPKKANCLFHHLQIIYAMLILNAIKFSRFPIWTLLLLTIPSSMCLITWMVYYPQTHPKIGFVNLEQPNCLNLPSDQHKLGCELLSFLIQDDKMQMESFQTEASALSSIHRGRNMAYFVIPRNFTTNTAQRLAFGRFADNATLVGSSIPVHMDYSHHVNNLFLLNGIWSGYKAFTTRKLAIEANDTEGGGIGTSLLLSPFKFNEKLAKLIPVETKFYDKASTAGVSSYIMIMQTTSALAIIVEKKHGIFQRTIIGGASLPHLLISAACAYGLIYLGQIGLNIATLLCLDIPFQGSIIDAVIINFGQYLIGLSVGVFIGLLLHEELEAIFFILGFFMLTLLTGSGFGDLYSLSFWLKWLVISLPSKLACLALENIMFRGWTIFNPGMISCFINQAVWIASALFLSVLAYCKNHT